MLIYFILKFREKKSESIKSSSIDELLKGTCVVRMCGKYIHVHEI